MSCHAKETEKKKAETLKEGRTKRAEIASQVLKEKPLKVVIITQDKARRLGKAAIPIHRRSHWLFSLALPLRPSAEQHIQDIQNKQEAVKWMANNLFAAQLYLSFN